MPYKSSLSGTFIGLPLRDIFPCCSAVDAKESCCDTDGSYSRYSGLSNCVKPSGLNFFFCNALAEATSESLEPCSLPLAGVSLFFLNSVDGRRNGDSVGV